MRTDRVEVHAMCVTGTLSLRLRGFRHTLQRVCSQSKVTRIRLIWNAKLSVGANVSVDSGLSVDRLCDQNSLDTLN